MGILFEENETTAPAEMRVLKAEIGTLTLEAGDVLAVIWKEPITDEAANYMINEIKRALPKGVHVIIFTEDVKLAVIKPVLGEGPEYALAKREG